MLLHQEGAVSSTCSQGKKNVTTDLLQLSLLNPHMCAVAKHSDPNEKKAPERTTRTQKCLGSRNLTSLSFSVSQFLLSLYSQTASKVPIHSAEISADLQLIRSSGKQAKPYF